MNERQPETMKIHVGKDDCPSPHSLRNKCGRVVWGLVWCLLFRPTPRICYGWRRLLLRIFGAKIGTNARISASVRIWAPWNLTVGDEASISHNVDCYCVDRLFIGNHATVSQYALLCSASHDISDAHMRLVTAPIVIADQSWVCAGAFVGPGVTVESGAVIGARAVAVRNVAAWTVNAGNPLRVIKPRTINEHKKRPTDSQVSPACRPQNDLLHAEPNSSRKAA